MSSNDFHAPIIAAAVCAVALNSAAQNGSLDAGFQAEANATVSAIAVQTNGYVLIAGAFTSVNGVPRNYIARLKDDGDLDLSFNPGSGANGGVRAVAIQDDGKVLIGGGFTTFDGMPANRIARLNVDGSLDTSFDIGTGPNSDVFAVAVQSNGQVVIAGDFASVNTSNRSRVARLNNDGSLDTSFATSEIGASGVRCLAIQSNGRIIIGGDFGSIGGTPRSGIARLRADGSLDISFYPGSGAAGLVNSVDLLTDGKVLIGGGFYSFNGIVRSRVARLYADGSLDASFNPGFGANGIVNGVAVQPDGKALIGGDFNSMNGVARTGIARLNPDGSLDSTFAPGLVPGRVSSIAVHDNGNAMLGGDFTSINGVARVRIARINADVLSQAATLSLKMYAGLTIVGQTGTTYRVEYTSNLNNQTLWHTLTDLSLSNSTQFYLDITSPYSSRRFYRAVTLP